MRKQQILQRICEEGVVAVLRGETPEQAVEMAEQAIAGGIKIIEVTMTVPFALEAIETLAKKYDPDPNAPNYAVIGVGTVLDAETARAAILSGAEFVVSPAFHEETVRMCNRYRVPIFPGAMTIAEIQAALEAGVDIVKLFPGNLFSPEMIKAIKGPLPQVDIMPTGGVSLDNLADWIKAGAVAVGIGSDLTREAIKTGDLSLVAQQASRYVEAYRKTKHPKQIGI